MGDMVCHHTEERKGHGFTKQRRGQRCDKLLGKSLRVQGCGRPQESQVQGCCSQFGRWVVEQEQVRLEAGQGDPHNLAKLQRCREVVKSLSYCHGTEFATVVAAEDT